MTPMDGDGGADADTADHDDGGDIGPERGLLSERGSLPGSCRARCDEEGGSECAFVGLFLGRC
jgi:hypothetical protein